MAEFIQTSAPGRHVLVTSSLLPAVHIFVVRLIHTSLVVASSVHFAHPFKSNDRLFAGPAQMGIGHPLGSF